MYDHTFVHSRSYYPLFLHSKLSVRISILKKKKFASSFKTPGHVPLLIASKGLLTARQGHTEMSVYLAQIARLTPVTAICEMMDAETYTALSLDKAEKFGKQNGIPLIDGKELLEYAKVH